MLQCPICRRIHKEEYTLDEEENNKVDSKVFVYEVPSISFFNMTETKRKNLIADGVLSTTRLRFIEEIVIVAQPIHYSCLVMVKDGRVPHYQVDKKQLMSLSPGNARKLKLADSCIGFVQVIDRGWEDTGFQWNEIARFVFSVSEKDCRGQAAKVDVLFPSNQGCTLDPEEQTETFGLAGPKPKKYTFHPVVQKVILEY